MIEVRPRLLRVLVANQVAFLNSGVLFAIWEWILGWPAPWIALLLAVRATVLSIIHFPKLALRLDGHSVTAPSGVMFNPTTLSISRGLDRSRMSGLTFIEDSQGNKANYRESWYPKDEISAFNRKLDQLTNRMTDGGGIPQLPDP